MCDQKTKPLSPADSTALSRYRAIAKFKKLKVWRRNRIPTTHSRRKNKDNAELLRGVLYSYKQMIKENNR